MNDVMLFSAVFAVVFASIVAFAAFHLYSGVRASMTNAKVGDIFNFEYVQPVTGDRERFMAKVIDVHSFTQDYIARLNSVSRYRKNDPAFQRSQHLVTAQTPDGKIRNFYAERTENVRRPLLGGVAFKTGLASLLF